MDAVARGQHRITQQLTYLAVQVSKIVEPPDFERLIQRAALLQKATSVDCMPIVAGRTIPEEIRQQAAKQHAGWIVLPANR